MTPELFDHPRPIVCTCGHPFGVHSGSPCYRCQRCACPSYYTDWTSAHALGLYPAGDGGAALPRYGVGSLALAMREVGPVAGGGEVAVCYHVATLGGRDSYGFLFSRGGHDGFSPNEAALFLRPLGDTKSKAALAYRFAGAVQLVRDYRDGRFAAAFSEAIATAHAFAQSARHDGEVRA